MQGGEDGKAKAFEEHIMEAKEKVQTKALEAMRRAGLTWVSEEEKIEANEKLQTRALEALRRAESSNLVVTKKNVNQIQDVQRVEEELTQLNKSLEVKKRFEDEARRKFEEEEKIASGEETDGKTRAYSLDWHVLTVV